MARFKGVERKEGVEDTPGMRIAAQQPANQILTPALYRCHRWHRWCSRRNVLTRAFMSREPRCLVANVYISHKHLRLQSSRYRGIKKIIPNRFPASAINDLHCHVLKEGIYKLE